MIAASEKFYSRKIGYKQTSTPFYTGFNYPSVSNMVARLQRKESVYKGKHPTEDNTTCSL
jgi:hypothetical protein